MNRKIIVALVLLIGFLMTYLSRIPLAFERGASWIWSYIPAGDLTAWFLFNLFHLGSLAPLVLFGYFYISGQVKWMFHAAALAHFVTTAYIYYSYQPSRGEDVISFVLFPAFIAFVTFIVGMIAYFVERKTAAVNSRR